jgi:hypothetical protein
LVGIAMMGCGDKAIEMVVDGDGIVVEGGRQWLIGGQHW